MKTPSYLGEAAAIIAVLSFYRWAAELRPEIAWVWMLFGILFLADWMLGGIADEGLCKSCFKD